MLDEDEEEVGASGKYKSNFNADVLAMADEERPGRGSKEGSEVQAHNFAVAVVVGLHSFLVHGPIIRSHAYVSTVRK